MPRLAPALIVAAALCFAACAGTASKSTAPPSSSSPASGTSAQPGASSAARTPTAAAGNATGGDTLDLTFTGALAGHWGTGDRSTGLFCSTSGNNRVQVNMFGLLSGVNYGLVVRQDGFTTGTYTFPVSGNPATAPAAQITTNSNAKAEWNLQGAEGKGSLTLAGDALTGVSGTIDADLADRQGGAAVHVTGTFKCKIGA